MPQKTVRVVLRGGLGNQLFQYGAALALSRRNNASLLIDTSLLPQVASTIRGVTRWPSQIDEFHHEGKFVDSKGPLRLTKRFLSPISQLERKIGDLAPTLLSKFGRFSNEERAQFRHFNSLTGNHVVLNSYCNSPRYFLEYAEVVRDTVRLLRNPSKDYLELSSVVQDTKPLAVHIRLGDYKNLSKIYGQLDPKYFSRSIDLQMRLTGDREIWLFSDEPALALNLMGASKHKVVVPPNARKLSGLETVLTMASCSGLVASNSTFSWWAAYLNSQKNACSIFPRPFFAPGGPAEPKDWLLENWLQLGRSI